MFCGGYIQGQVGRIGGVVTEEELAAGPPREGGVGSRLSVTRKKKSSDVIVTRRQDVSQPCWQTGADNFGRQRNR